MPESAAQSQLRKLAIVPAFNEGEMVGRVVRDINRSAPDFDVLVVDDGSADSTAAEAEQAGAVVISHPFNLGIGGAMQTGYKYALREGYDVAAQVDGDGQHKPGYLPSCSPRCRPRARPTWSAAAASAATRATRCRSAAGSAT